MKLACCTEGFALLKLCTCTASLQEKIRQICAKSKCTSSLEHPMQRIRYREGKIVFSWKKHLFRFQTNGLADTYHIKDGWLPTTLANRVGYCTENWLNSEMVNYTYNRKKQGQVQGVILATLNGHYPDGLICSFRSSYSPFVWKRAGLQ